jgi:cytochrome c oxidase subunit 2
VAGNAGGRSMEEMGQVTKAIEHAKRCGLALLGFVAPAAAFAQPVDWQVGFQEPASPIMQRIDNFNNGLLILVTLITLFVVGLLVLAIIRFRAKVNPVPSKTTHNTVIEVLWTVIPVLILVGIAIPSFGLLFAQYDPARVIQDYDPEDAINIKVTGQTWVWQYAYPDHGIRTYTSSPILDPAATDAAGRPVYAGEPRLLETNLPMVVPVDTVVRLQVTSDPNGVLHAFSINAMGVKLDAVPGRIVESWFLAEREGTFYGQCSELCGRYHYAMPIEVRVVSQDQFDQWVEAAAANINAAKELLDTWEAERLAQVAAR